MGEAGSSERQPLSSSGETSDAPFGSKDVHQRHDGITTLEFAQLLSRLEGQLERHHRTRLIHALQRGLEPGATRVELGKIDLPSSETLEALYSWRDGTGTTGVLLDEIQLFPGFYMLSLGDAVANYQAFVSDTRWDSTWFPLFANGGGDFYFIESGGVAGGAIRHFRVEQTDHPREFGSLPSMMRTVLAAYVSGVIFVDSSGFLEMDDEKFASLASDLNPEIAWWSN